jgi:hypothetical protein
VSSTGPDRVIATALGRDAVIAATSLNEPVPIVAGGHNDFIAPDTALAILMTLITLMMTLMAFV